MVLARHALQIGVEAMLGDRWLYPGMMQLPRALHGADEFLRVCRVRRAQIYVPVAWATRRRHAACVRVVLVEVSGAHAFSVSSGAGQST